MTVRKAYSRHDTVRPALASLIGTVNQSTGFLSDDTGNRRFLVATIEAIDWSYTQIDIHQIWAEALAAFKRGESHRLTAEERAVQDKQNKLHETESIIEDWITSHFVVGIQAGAARMTAGEIIDHLRALRHPAERQRASAGDGAVARARPARRAEDPHE